MADCFQSAPCLDPPREALPCVALPRQPMNCDPVSGLAATRALVSRGRLTVRLVPPPSPAAAYHLGRAAHYLKDRPYPRESTDSGRLATRGHTPVARPGRGLHGGRTHIPASHARERQGEQARARTHTLCARAPDGRVEAVRPRARVHPSPPSLRGGRPSLGRPARWRNPSMSRSTLARAAAASFAVHGAMGWRAPPAIFRSRVISFMLRTSDAMSRTLAAPGASRLKSASRCSTSSTIPSRHSVSVNASPQSTVPLAPHGCRGSFRPLLAR